MSDTHLIYPDNVIQTHRFQYCPICQAPLKRDALFADNLLHTHCAACGWIQLVSNCICVAAVVRHNGGIVVIQPPDGDGAGFPAGIVEYGENPQDTIIRETLEETGLVVEIVRDLGWSYVSYEDFPGPTVISSLKCNLLAENSKKAMRALFRCMPSKIYHRFHPNVMAAIWPERDFWSKWTRLKKLNQRPKPPV